MFDIFIDAVTVNVDRSSSPGKKRGFAASEIDC